MRAPPDMKGIITDIVEPDLSRDAYTIPWLDEQGEITPEQWDKLRDWVRVIPISQ